MDGVRQARQRLIPPDGSSVWNPQGEINSGTPRADCGLQRRGRGDVAKVVRGYQLPVMREIKQKKVLVCLYLEVK